MSTEGEATIPGRRNSTQHGADVDNAGKKWEEAGEEVKRKSNDNLS